MLSLSGNSFARALSRAGTAVDALLGIDGVGGTLEDSFGGASILAAAATNALVSSNLVSHFFTPSFVLVLYSLKTP
jgi:hypothetical protein